MQKTVFLIIMTATIISSCGNSSAFKDPQKDPKALAEAIFNAAKSADYSGLAALVDTDADNDSKMIAQAATDKATQEEFKKYFSKGRVSGEPVIEGEKASVKILFGPEGTNEETFEMVKKNGKWYLQSF